jgi:hypothetical protein
LFSLDFTPAFQSWQIDPASLFSAPTVKKANNPGVCKHLEKEAIGCSSVILWLDCDREGEVCRKRSSLLFSRLVFLTEHLFRSPRCDFEEAFATSYCA